MGKANANFIHSVLVSVLISWYQNHMPATPDLGTKIQSPEKEHQTIKHKTTTTLCRYVSVQLKVTMTSILQRP